MNEYSVVIRFTRLEPVEDFIQTLTFAENEEEAKKQALREFWRLRNPDPHPVVEIERVTITPV